MTRLIDADELKAMCERSLEYAERCLHAETSDFGHLITLSSVQTWKFMIEILDEEAPTVDAIPVEWINHYMDTELTKGSLFYSCMSGFMRDWKAEQEKQNG